MMPHSTDRYRRAIEQFDAANGADPRAELHQGKEYPKELLYAQRMTQWLGRLAPDATEPVRLAVHAQHICRWEIPRSAYPNDRLGYRKWRTDLGRFHAETAGRILREVGYDEPTIGRVQTLLRKERLKADSDCQLLEDVVCLVFLEHYFLAFTQEHDEAKLVNILQRTWKKMSPRGRRAALEMPLAPAARALVEKALA